MALSLRQRAAIMQNQNARERVRMAIQDIADGVAKEVPAEGATEAEITLTNRRVKFAGALLQYAETWINPVLTRILPVPAVSGLGHLLALDSNLLNAEDESNIDMILLTAIQSVYDTLIPSEIQ